MFTASTGYSSLVCFSWRLFADHVNPRLVKWYQRHAPNWLWGLIWLPLSVHICLGLVVENWPFVVACTRHSYFKLYCLCFLSFLFKLLLPPTPPHTAPAYPLNTLAQYWWIPWKNCQNWEKPAIIYLPGYSEIESVSNLVVSYFTFQADLHNRVTVHIHTCTSELLNLLTNSKGLN